MASDGKVTDQEYEQLSELFWESAEPLLARPGTEEGTMMGTPCLRVNGEFVGMVTQTFEGRLIVKLHRDTVDTYIKEKVGDSFSPANKVFREWLHVRGNDSTTWEKLLEESWDFVSTLKPKKKNAKKKPAKKKPSTKK